MLGKQRASIRCFSDLADRQTDADGRCGSLMAPGTLTPGLIVVGKSRPDMALTSLTGRYRMDFNTEAYFASIGVRGFYPYVQASDWSRPVVNHYNLRNLCTADCV